MSRYEFEAATEGEITPQVENEGEAPAVSHGDDTTANETQTEEVSEDVNETDEVSDDGDGQETEDEGNEDEPQKPGKRRFKKRIDQLQRKIAERDQFIAEMQDRFIREQQTQSTQEDSELPNAPQRESYDDYEQYVQDLAVHKAQEVMREQQTQSKAQEQQQTQARAVEQFNAVKDAALDAGKEIYEDFETVATAQDLPLTQTMAEAILSSENAPHVWYHVGKDKELAAEIAALPPIQQALAIGRLSTTIAPQASKQPSKAPTPPAPVKNRAQARTGPSDTQSTADWMKRRNKEIYGT